MARTYWLSFCDPARPEGQRFLGACVVEVSDEQAADALTLLKQEFPRAKEGAAWIRAACTVAWEMGCNPGGEIGAVEITGQPQAVAYPHHRLMQRAQIEAIDRQMVGEVQ